MISLAEFAKYFNFALSAIASIAAILGDHKKEGKIRD